MIKQWLSLLLVGLTLLLLIQWLPLTQSDFCPPGQTPQFVHGFAFLKQLLGETMGEPLECEHYDAQGNAFQQTTTGRAVYDRSTNTPSFIQANRQWSWTAQGLIQMPADSAPLLTVTPLLTSSLRVMSYNVLFGAGATPAWEQRAAQLSPFPYPGNRLPAILNVIQAARPDIVGIQEAGGWLDGHPAVVEQVAQELGMAYFVAETPSGLHLVLLTRLPVVETENLSDRLGGVGALRAKLALGEGRPDLQVFVVHLDPFSTEARLRQLAFLTEVMAPYLDTPVILMGDTNVSCLDRPEHCPEYQRLQQAGWRLVMREQYQLNQIWTSPLLAESVTEITFPQANFDISDHLPVGATLTLPSLDRPGG